MLLTISTVSAGDAEPSARDLGRVLHKHPDRVQTFSTAAGVVHVMYPRADDEAATLAMLLEVDPIGLTRNAGAAGADLGHYVNARPYLAGSLLAVALRTVFSTALAGRCEAAPELAEREWPLEVRVPTMPCRGSADLPARLFGPLGWQVRTTAVQLDERFPDWGPAPFVDATLAGRLRVADALSHLYVLLPVLDDAKHYWVGRDEVDKLMRKAGPWLGSHPERALITRRYLAHQSWLASEALRRLAASEQVPVEELDDALAPARLPSGTAEDDVADDSTAVTGNGPDEAAQARRSLALQRHDAVLAALAELAPASVADLGCGSGALLRKLIGLPSVSRVVGCDVSAHAVAVAIRRLNLDQPPTRASLASQVEVFQSSLVYADDRLRGLDAAVLMEVVEHVDDTRLEALARVVFGHAAPRSVVVTTPNIEYNVRYDGLPAGQLRHRDHRFEWTRQEFADWAAHVAQTHGYRVGIGGIGELDDEVGQPSQLAVFTRQEGVQ